MNRSPLSNAIPILGISLNAKLLDDLVCIQSLLRIGQEKPLTDDMDTSLYQKDIFTFMLRRETSAPGPFANDFEWLQNAMIQIEFTPVDQEGTIRVGIYTTPSKVYIAVVSEDDAKKIGTYPEIPQHIPVLEVMRTQPFLQKSLYVLVCIYCNWFVENIINKEAIQHE